MKWKFQYTRQAYNFLSRENLFEEVEDRIIRFLKGEKIDVKKLKGKLKGFLRLRIGKVRVIFELRIEDKKVIIVRAGYRGKIYK